MLRCKKKGTTSKTRDITLGPILTATGKSEPNLTTNWNGHIGKGGEEKTKVEADTRGGGKKGLRH
jgi:hypothetical protein